MNYDTARLIIGLATLLLNYSMWFMLFERRFGRLVSYCVPVLFTAVLYLIIFSTGLHQAGVNYTGISHILVLMLVFKGRFFQKVFALFVQMQVVAAFMILAGIISGAVAQDNEKFSNLVQVMITLALYGGYVVFLRFMGYRILRKMYLEARNAEWAFYAFTSVISFFMLVLYQDKIVTDGDYAVFLFYTLWNVVILCFAVINTHEKSKQKYEAEHAREIITTGKEHYQKMNEMYDELRIMRHDYKYHLDALSELLKSNNKNEIDQYLADIKKQLSEKEFPIFCSNSVLNALITTYVERFMKLNITYTIKIALPGKTIPNYEMCIVLGNLLQNALEACLHLNGNRKIEMTINMHGAHLVVFVKNSFSGEITAKDDLPASTKTDGGFGLRSVQAIAARYDGELITEWTENTFSVYVMVKI